MIRIFVTVNINNYSKYVNVTFMYILVYHYYNVLCVRIVELHYENRLNMTPLLKFSSNQDQS